MDIKKYMDNYYKLKINGKEASRYFGIRENTIGDILRGEYRLLSKNYQVEDSNKDKVLKENDINTLNEYYELHYINN